MGVLSQELIERYVSYKQKVLSHYSRLLSEHSSTSAGILIESLQAMESKHAREIMVSRSIMCPLSVDFSTELALTPIHEMETVSKVFNQVISIKESLLDEHFADVPEELLESIRSLETDIHKQMVAKKNKYHI